MRYIAKINRAGLDIEVYTKIVSKKRLKELVKKSKSDAILVRLKDDPTEFVLIKTEHYLMGSSEQK